MVFTYSEIQLVIGYVSVCVILLIVVGIQIRNELKDSDDE